MNRTTLRIPAPLRSFVGGSDQIQVEGDDIAAVLADLSSRYQELARRILDGHGRPRPFVNLFLDNSNIRDLEDLDSQVPDGSVIHVIPAVAGGI